jgi:glycosyltransferase involved in cell wall biosynthesis
MDVKILHVVGDSKFGGASRDILRLAAAWSPLGWKTDVLATDPVFMEAARKAGVSVIPLEVIWRPIRPWRDLTGLLRLWFYLLGHRYTVVHTHTTKAGFVGRLAARLAGVPIVVHTVHGFAFHERSSWLKIRFYALVEKIAACCCDRIVTVSRFHIEWARRLGIATLGKLLAIENGVSDQKRLAGESREAARARWGIAGNELVLLSAGRLADEKGLEYLIAAAAILQQKLGRPFRIVLAGDGDLRSQLEDLARASGVADIVEFLGFRSQIASLLAASDIVVLPTLREGLSIALLEAMSAEVPIVATAIGSNREATREGEAALLIPTQSPEAIANAVQRLNGDPALARSLAARAREIYLERYGHRRMMSAYYRMYRDLLQSHSIQGAEGLCADVRPHPLPEASRPDPVGAAL